jgi:Tol biopolymer transport system component
MDIFEMNISDFSSELIYEHTDGMDFQGLSKDRKYIALGKTINTNDADLFLMNTETKEITKINENQSGNRAADFAPDNSALYYTTDDGAEFSYVMKYTIADGAKEKVLEKNWDVSSYYFTQNGKFQVSFSNEDAKNVMIITEVATGNQLQHQKTFILIRGLNYTYETP